MVNEGGGQGGIKMISYFTALIRVKSEQKWTYFPQAIRRRNRGVGEVRVNMKFNVINGDFNKSRKSKDTEDYTNYQIPKLRVHKGRFQKKVRFQKRSIPNTGVVGKGGGMTGDVIW